LNNTGLSMFSRSPRAILAPLDGFATTVANGGGAGVEAPVSGNVTAEETLALVKVQSELDRTQAVLGHTASFTGTRTHLTSTGTARITKRSNKATGGSKGIRFSGEAGETSHLLPQYPSTVEKQEHVLGSPFTQGRTAIAVQLLGQNKNSRLRVLQQHQLVPPPTSDARLNALALGVTSSTPPASLVGLNAPVPPVQRLPLPFGLSLAPDHQISAAAALAVRMQMGSKRRIQDQASRPMSMSMSISLQSQVNAAQSLRSKRMQRARKRKARVRVHGVECVNVNALR
jgi:hypothetical protein